MCLSVLMVGLSGCAPFNAQLNLFTVNKYSLGEESVYSNRTIEASFTEPTKAYGNGNRVMVTQGNFLYKSPMSNSSNNASASFPLMGL